MSTIIAKKNDKIIELVSDTLIGSDSKRRSFKAGKVIQIADIIIGMSGWIEVLQFVKAVLQKDETDELNAMADILLNASNAEQITKFFKSIYPHMINDKAREKYHGSSFIIVMGAGIYKHSNFLTIEPDSDYLAIGSGARYAEGALEMGATVQSALEIAAKLDLHTGGMEYYSVDI